jgi:hypothetical protein
VSWIREHLQAAPPSEQKAPKETEQLLKDLDSDEFDVRRRAEQTIEALGEEARSALEKTLADRPSLDKRRTVERLLAKLEPGGGPEQRRSVRAVEVLEHIATPEARQELQKHANGAAKARLTREAKAALVRLERRQSLR